MYQLALLDAELAIQCDSGFAEVPLTIALSRYREFFNNAAIPNLTLSQAFFCQGVTLRHLGSISDSVKALKEAVDLDETCIEYQQALDEVKAITSNGILLFRRFN